MNTLTRSFFGVTAGLMLGMACLAGQRPVAQAAGDAPLTQSKTHLPMIYRAPCPVAVPAGWTQIAPGAGDNQGEIGAHLSMVLDSCQDPMLAYVWLDPNGDGDYSDNKLYFRRFLRGSGVFSQPVMVEGIGVINTSAPQREVALARDASTGAIGIAYQATLDGVQRIRLAISSDNGQTWQKETLPTNDTLGVTSPALAMAHGKTYVAYNEINYGGHFLSRNGNSGAFGDQAVPALPATDPTNFPSAPMILKTDAAGEPGLAYMLGADSSNGISYNVTAAFWRPGSAAVKVFDSNGVQDDAPTLALAFDGVNPRVAALLHRSENWAHESSLYFSQSANRGDSFAAPVQVPLDGGNDFGAYTSLAINSRGGAATVTHSGGGNNVNTVCGMPKVSTSADLAHWATCGITALDDPSTSYYDGAHDNSAFNAFDMLMIAMEADRTGGSGGGILFYRAP